MNAPSIPQGFSLFHEDLEQILELSKHDLLALQGCNILLTGCTAFFGKWLIESLLWADLELKLRLKLTVLTRSSKHFLEAMPHFLTRKNLHLVQGDILSLSKVDIPDFDFAVHGVNLPNDLSLSWPARHMYTAVLGTENIMTIAAQKGCRNLLLLSSGAVYGIQARQVTIPFTENSLPVDMREPAIYGNTKRFLEFYAQAKGEELGISVSVARCFAFIGAYMPLNEQNAMSSFLLHALQRRPITINGDGTPLRSFLSGRDLSIWLLAALIRGNGRIYNIGSTQTYSLHEWAKKVLFCAELPENFLTVKGQALRGNAPNAYQPDTSAIRQDLNLTETASPEKNIETTLKWFLAHQHLIPLS